MSRLTADQESRGGDGAPGAGEIDSLMRVNLAEGCGAVNDERRGLSGLSGLSCLSRLRTGQSESLGRIDQIDQID
jgi:hypothetical protein